MRIHTSFFVVVLIYCALLSAAGCNRGPTRYAVEGTVTLNGEPLDVGYINFRPLPGTASPTAGGEIKNGKYHISRDGGPMVGEFRVEITASRPGKDTYPDATGKEVPVYEQYLPDKYNSRSELRANVEADAPNRFNFSLDM